MGKITDVFYTEIPNYDTHKAGEYYFHHNVVALDDIFIDGYLEHEASQVELRNKILSDAMKDIPSHPKPNTCIMGISSIKNKVVLAVEY